jgi:hypothetical protein
MGASAGGVHRHRRRFVIRINGKHLYNPANLGVIVGLTLLPGAWISPGQWGNDLFKPNALVWALFLLTPLVPLLDRLWPARRHAWREPGANSGHSRVVPSATA